MKNVKVFVTANSSADINGTGYSVSATDKTPDIDYSIRSFQSGFSVPFLVSIGDEDILADDIYGYAGLEDANGGRDNLIYRSSQDSMMTIPTSMTLKDAKAQKAIRSYKAINLAK